MSKIMNITGYWNMDWSGQYNEKDMWEGKILLEEDGWFEGLVVDPYSSYKEDRFVFGVYFPDKFIKLYKMTPLNISSPFVFSAFKEKDEYNGNFDVIGMFGTRPYGATSITTEPILKDVDEEITTLKERKEKYINEVMDYTNKEFYGNSLDMRNSMCKILLANYEGRKFSTEEVNEIMEECQPVNQRVFDSTLDEIFGRVDSLVEEMSDEEKQAFKKMMEEDLPFEFLDEMEFAPITDFDEEFDDAGLSSDFNFILEEKTQPDPKKAEKTLRKIIDENGGLSV